MAVVTLRYVTLRYVTLSYVKLRSLIKGTGAKDGERSFGCQLTATRSRHRAIKGQEPGLVDGLLQPPEGKRVRDAKRRS